jgi:hypothetical protein
MKKTATAVALSMFAVGCSNGPTAPSTTLTPELRKATAAVLRKHLKDPYSARDVQISPIVQNGVEGFAYGEWTWTCVQLNSKNSFGAYTGLQVVAVGFRPPSDRYRYQFDPRFVCQGLNAWQPFPELTAG